LIVGTDFEGHSVPLHLDGAKVMLTIRIIVPGEGIEPGNGVNDCLTSDLTGILDRVQ
jgi:hypothetical protein